MNNQEARNIANKFVKHYGENMVNAFLFGSTARGKENPNDVDVLDIKKDSTNVLDLSMFPDVNLIVYSESYAN